MASTQLLGSQVLRLYRVENDGLHFRKGGARVVHGRFSLVTFHCACTLFTYVFKTMLRLRLRAGAMARHACSLLLTLLPLLSNAALSRCLACNILCSPSAANVACHREVRNNILFSGGRKKRA